MVKSAEKAGCGDGSNSMGSVAPFLRKCYDMVDDKSTDEIISWNDADDCFVIWDMTQFSVQLLPMYFKHQNFSSFMRQLNIYGFRKMDSDSWVFAHDSFLRGQKHLLKDISRRKHTAAHEQRRIPEQKENGHDELAEKELNDLWKAVETLKIDKSTLSQELTNLRQHHEKSESKLLLLRERLQGMEKSQQQMLSFLVLAMQYPEYFINLLQPKENNWHAAEAAKVLVEDSKDDTTTASDAMIIRYQSPASETSSPAFTPVLASENPSKPSICTDEKKDIFSDSEFMKFLIDDKVFSLENASHFGLLDWTDDGSWQQLLLSSPFRESSEQTKVDDEEYIHTDMDVVLASLGTTSELWDSINSE